MASKAVLKSGQQAVASAGTAEALVASSLWTREITIAAPAGNVGNMFLGDSTVDSTSGRVLEPGDSVTLKAADPDRGDAGLYLPFDLSAIYVDSATNGDAVTWTYWEFTT